MNGYINIEIGGQKRGIKFGNRALLDIMSKHQLSGGNIKFSFDLVVDLVYYGLINNCMVKKQNVDFTEEEVGEWVDDMQLPDLMSVFNTFQASYAGETLPGAEKAVTKSEAAEAKKSE